MSRKLVVVLALLSVLFSSSAGVCAPAEERPIILVIAGPAGEAESPSDPDVVSAVKAFLMDWGRLEMLTFEAEHPTIARSVVEGKLKQDAVRRASEPRNAVEIAHAVGATYALIVHGSIVEDKVGIALQLFEARGSGQWTAGAESRVAQGRGPIQNRNRKNAISTAASAAVSQLAVLAEGPLAQPISNTPEEYTPPRPAPPVETPESRDLVAEYTSHMRKAETYSRRGDVPNVIYELRQAVNIEPSTVSVRIKLANTYASLGMVEKAIDECRRVLLFKPDDASIYNVLAELYLANGAAEEAAAQYRAIARLDPEDVQARIDLGNVYWNQGKLDDAAAAYEEAARIDPGNAASHERLYKLYSARKDHAAALEHLSLSKTLEDGARDATDRYGILAGIVREEFDAILGKLDASRDDYVARKLTREDYYKECRDASLRAEGLAKFLSDQKVPEEYKASHAHGVLAVSLLSQSGGLLLSYLETDKQAYADQSQLLRIEARSELDLFGKTTSGA